MIRHTCDGCLEDLDLSDGYIGVDEFILLEDDDDSEESDGDYAFHFHLGSACLWAWVSQRHLENVE